jgi:arsenate reductase
VAATLYGIPNCDSVKKARGWLDAHGVAYEFHDYKKRGAPAEKLAKWADAVGWERLLNRAGTTFRGLPQEERADVDRAKALRLMATHPSLIKRPVVEQDHELLVGFKSDEFEQAFG